MPCASDRNALRASAAVARHNRNPNRTRPIQRRNEFFFLSPPNFFLIHKGLAGPAAGAQQGGAFGFRPLQAEGLLPGQLGLLAGHGALLSVLQPRAVPERLHLPLEQHHGAGRVQLSLSVVSSGRIERQCGRIMAALLLAHQRHLPRAIYNG